MSGPAREVLLLGQDSGPAREVLLLGQDSDPAREVLLLGQDKEVPIQDVEDFELCENI